MYGRDADFFYNEFDRQPTWRQSNASRPHRITATGIYELPFGKGRSFLQSGVFSHIAGGFQFAATYEYQPGPLLSWGNYFYYGDPDDINTGPRTLDRWFNTANFERTASRGPAAFHVRTMPIFIEGLRAHSTNQWNVNAQRDFRITERVRLQLRMDALNLANRTQFAAPDGNPYSTNFGRVTAQTNTRNRFLQVQGRIRF